MNSIGTELGNEIRRIRLSLGISQEELAFKAGISAAHLGQIERALKNPTVETVSNIADALGVTLSELFSFYSDKSDTSKTSPLTNKITAYLSSMDEDQQRDVLKILKIIKKSHK